MEGGFNFKNEIPAVAFAFPRNALDVFGINADSGKSGFHYWQFVSTNFGIMML